MKLSSFLVKEYRSISEADIPLSDVTVLLGKNNEGKTSYSRNWCKFSTCLVIRAKP